MDDLTEAAVPIPGKRRKPPGWWKLVTFVAGAIGAMGAIAGAGTASYDINPYRVELRARPALAGQTELAIRPPQLNPGFAYAGTHAGPIALRATITGVSGSLVPSDVGAITTPRDAAGFFAEEGKDAIRSFALLCAGLALAGGAAAGVAISFGRWQRVLGAAISGLLTFAIIGVVVAQTYDIEEFMKSGSFARDGGAPVVFPSETPSFDDTVGVPSP